MKPHRTMLSLASLILAVNLAPAADVSGKWKSEFTSPIGELKYLYDLKAEGQNLSGKAIREMDGQKTETEIKEGKASGDEVSFVEMLKFDDQDVRIEYTGRLTGDEIKFTRKVGDFATLQIVARREAPVASGAAGVAGQWQAEFDTQIGQQKYLFTLKPEKGELSGQANAEIGGQKYETKLTEGKLKGDEIFFVEPLKFQEADLRIEYSGKVSGDEMKLARKVGDVATEQLVARRVKSGAASAGAKSPPIALKVVKVDSEETAGENGKGANAVDGDPSTHWHTQWQDDSPGYPHEIIIDLGAPTRIKGFTYLPRQDEQVNGTIKRYEFYVSDDAKEFGDPVNKGEFADGKQMKTVTFEPKSCRYVRLRARSEMGGQPWASAAEIGVIPE